MNKALAELEPSIFTGSEEKDFAFISTSDNHEYNWYQISQKILSEIFPDKTVNNFSVSKIENMADELTMYGFLTKTKNYISAENSGLSIVQHGYNSY